MAQFPIALGQYGSKLNSGNSIWRNGPIAETQHNMQHFCNTFRIVLASNYRLLLDKLAKYQGVAPGFNGWEIASPLKKH